MGKPIYTSDGNNIMMDGQVLSIDDIFKLLETNEQLLTACQEVIDLIPVCGTHGRNCIPYYKEWITKQKQLPQKLSELTDQYLKGQLTNNEQIIRRFAMNLSVKMFGKESVLDAKLTKPVESVDIPLGKDETKGMNLQDFACAVSDLFWGGELGWDRDYGLDELFSVIKRRFKVEVEETLAEQITSIKDIKLGSSEASQLVEWILTHKHIGNMGAPTSEVIADKVIYEPTMKLRWLKTETYISELNEFKKILQQCWLDAEGNEIWEDIPEFLPESSEVDITN